MSMQACDRAPSVQPCGAGAVMGKQLPISRRARAPGPAVGNKLEDFSR